MAAPKKRNTLMLDMKDQISILEKIEKKTVFQMDTIDLMYVDACCCGSIDCCIVAVDVDSKI
ncbi:hypothetical protein Glove_606g119 [Diversispora epigaea]|uniref:Uncharacterized protein n=1 Tax=Diversispora epigaea TaxID=1348612 RepID=A0A397G6Z9_9GLOM|nr:hypothetical protein Glove_606g119 [Diversispora epigaea]